MSVRSIGVVLVGLLLIVVASTAIDALLHRTGVYPPAGQPMPDALWLLATAYRAVIGAAGGYVAARLANRRPMAHALALGVIGVVLSSIGAVVTWKEGPGFGPKWYSLGLIAIALPSSWLGGRLSPNSREPRGQPAAN